MADEARCTPLHPENMDATCSDVRELLAPTSFHVVHSALGKLSPTMESQRERENIGCRTVVGTTTGVPE